MHITFETNKELDKEIIFDFLQSNNQKTGIDFAQGIIDIHPTLSKAQELKENARSYINTYVDEYYSKHTEEIKKCIEKVSINWKKDEGVFFEIVNRIFKGMKAPSGKYTGYASIVNCNPRFLDNLTFQFYYNSNITNFIIAHEVLHFFFYAYTAKVHADIFKDLDPNNGIYWDLAEIFNAILMSSPDFISKEYYDICKPYPVHEKYISYAKELWMQDEDIDNWVVEMIGLLTQHLPSE